VIAQTPAKIAPEVHGIGLGQKSHFGVPVESHDGRRGYPTARRVKVLCHPSTLTRPAGFFLQPLRCGSVSIGGGFARYRTVSREPTAAGKAPANRATGIDCRSAEPWPGGSLLFCSPDTAGRSWLSAGCPGLSSGRRDLLPAAWTVTPAEIPHCERCGLAAILQLIRASLRQSRCNSGQGALSSGATRDGTRLSTLCRGLASEVAGWWRGERVSRGIAGNGRA
jgi:hypothetical protein